MDATLCIRTETYKPGLYNMLVNGGFYVRRSENFCRVGVDMALKQTINAEAKNRLKGIIAFADINSAVNRWLLTSSMRAQIVNQILDIADMSPNTDPQNKELKRYGIEKDANDLSSLIDSVVDTLIPFQFGVNCDALYNVKTGKKVSVNAEKYLLSVMEDGKKKGDMFVNECSKDSSRFEKPIKPTKIELLHRCIR